MQPGIETNPFQPSVLDRDDSIGSHLQVDFAPILHRWEKYRLWYNGVLIAYTVLCSAWFMPEILLDGLFWFQLCILGAMSNLCFFLGPAIEAYGRYFGLWSRVLSLLLFLLGLMLTGLLDTAFLFVRVN